MPAGNPHRRQGIEDANWYFVDKLPMYSPISIGPGVDDF